MGSDTRTTVVPTMIPIRCWRECRTPNRCDGKRLRHCRRDTVDSCARVPELWPPLRASDFPVTIPHMTMERWSRQPFWLSLPSAQEPPIE